MTNILINITKNLQIIKMKVKRLDIAIISFRMFLMNITKFIMKDIVFPIMDILNLHIMKIMSFIIIQVIVEILTNYKCILISHNKNIFMRITRINIIQLGQLVVMREFLILLEELQRLKLSLENMLI